MDTKEYIDLIGRDTLLDNGLSQQALSNAIRDGGFPAAWYGHIRSIATQKFIITPMYLFRWKQFCTSAGYQSSHEQEIKSL